MTSDLKISNWSLTLFDVKYVFVCIFFSRGMSILICYLSRCKVRQMNCASTPEKCEISDFIQQLELYKLFFLHGITNIHFMYWMLNIVISNERLIDWSLFYFSYNLKRYINLLENDSSRICFNHALLFKLLSINK